MGRIEDLGLVADKGLEWKQRAVDAEAERDQLRAERDASAAHAEAAERENLRLLKENAFMFTELGAVRDELMEAQAHAQDLRRALEEAVERLDRPYQAYSGDRAHCQLCLGPQTNMGWLNHDAECCVADLKTYLARTPAQSFNRVKEEALREVAGTLGVQAPIRTSQYDDFGSGKEKAWRDCIELLESIADRLKKEATDAPDPMA